MSYLGDKREEEERAGLLQHQSFQDEGFLSPPLVEDLNGKSSTLNSPQPHAKSTPIDSPPQKWTLFPLIPFLGRTFSIIVLLVALICLTYNAVITIGEIQEYIKSFGYVVPGALLLFSLFHSLYTLGPVLSILLCLFVLLLSWSFEELSLISGLWYGNLEYTASRTVMQSPHILGVPVTVPFSYYMTFYPAFWVADILLYGGARAARYSVEPLESRGRFGVRVTAHAMLVAFLMVAWDLVVDPVSSTWCGIWSFDSGFSFYFGIPLINFLGWFFTFFFISLLYSIAEIVLKPSPRYRLIALDAFLPIFAWSILGCAYMISALPLDLSLIVFFGMGLPACIGMARLVYDSSSLFHFSTQDPIVDAVEEPLSPDSDSEDEATDLFRLDSRELDEDYES